MASAIACAIGLLWLIGATVLVIALGRAAARGDRDH